MSEGNKEPRKVPNLVLQEERSRRGWTQQDVADRVGTTVVNVSRWERGATSPNPYFRQQISRVFEKEPEELGLSPMREHPQSEPTPLSEERMPNLSEEEKAPPIFEKELAFANKQVPGVPDQKHFLERRKAIVAVATIGLAALTVGGGILLFEKQPQQNRILPVKANTQNVDLQKPTGKVIGQDTFQRSDQTFWGTASDGQKWMGEVNSMNIYSIANHAARIDTSNSVYNGLLGTKVSNAEVLFTGSLTGFNSSNLGAVLRWTDANNWYKAYIDGDSLVLQKKVNGTATYLPKVPFSPKASTLYTIRFRAVGTTLAAKVWLATSREPSDWMTIASDSEHASGYCGLRIQVQNGASATVTSFLALEVS